MAQQPQGFVGGSGSIQPGFRQGGQVGGQQGGQMGGQVGGQTGGQFGGGTTQQMGGGVQAARGTTIDQALTPQMRAALYGFVEAAKVCDWCADQCIGEGPQMAQCIRLCRDVVDVAALNFKLISRDSVFGPELAEVFVQVADECAQECARHSEVHCQECAQVLNQTIQSVQEMLSSFGQGQQGFQQQGVQVAQQQGAPIPQQGQGEQIPQHQGMRSSQY